MTLTNEERIALAYKLAEGQKVQAVLHGGGVADALFNDCAEFAGRSGWTHAYSVVFHPGAFVSEHAHPEDVVLFYPADVTVPVVVAGEKIYPKAGEMLLVLKHVKHEVLPNSADTPRVSIAVKVTDA